MIVCTSFEMTDVEHERLRSIRYVQADPFEREKAVQLMRHARAVFDAVNHGEAYGQPSPVFEERATEDGRYGEWRSVLLDKVPAAA